MQFENQRLESMLSTLEDNLMNDNALSPEFYDEINSHPEYGVELLQAFASSSFVNGCSEGLLMACYYFIELCLVQLRLALEHHQRWAEKHIENYQDELVRLMETEPDGGHWMSMMNVFFDAGIPLDERVKGAYLNLLEAAYASDEGNLKQQVMFQQLLADESESTAFELADMFFAQTNALPVDFFPSFLQELIEHGSDKSKNVAVMFLLHPDATVRDSLLVELPLLFGNVVLPAESMSRLLVIRHWLPEEQRKSIDSLVASQRKNGCTFSEFAGLKLVSVHATEMDGSGAQALFFLMKKSAHVFQAGGLLVKRDQGIKDAWLSPELPKEEAESFASKGLSKGLNLRLIDKQYAEIIVAHHVAKGSEKNITPELSVLHLQELLNANWQGQPLAMEATLSQLESELGEINGDWIDASLKRSGRWHKTKSFAQSWFEESAELDKLVNRHCSFVDGVKHCDLDAASVELLDGYFKDEYLKWAEHFLWMALWAKPSSRHNEYLWKDCVILVQLILEGIPMSQLPVMVVICEESVLLSIETMQYRKTHLS